MEFWKAEETIPSCHHVLTAVQLAETNTLVSAKTENKGVFPRSPAKPGPRLAKPHGPAKSTPANTTSLSSHTALIPPPS